MIGLVVVRHQAAVAGRDAGRPRLVREVRRGIGQRAFADVEMHDPQRFPRHGGEARLLAHEPREHAGAALGGLVEQEAVADVARGHRLGEHLAFLELEHRLDAAQDRMLHGDQRNVRERIADGLEEERVLAVLDAGHDPLPGRGGGVEGALVRVVVLVPGPVPRYRIDAEAEDLLVRPAPQPLVQARDRRPGAVGHAHDLALRVGGRREPHVELAVADRPLERRLQVEALALALFVVGGDLLGRLRGDVLDPVRVAHDLGVAERRSAGVARRPIVVEVPGAAARADPHGPGGQLRIGGRRPPVAEREQGAHDPVGASLVVDEAARAELGKRQEARTLEVGLPPTAVPACRDVREERQPGEVVPGQEALRGEVAVGVEVARERVRPPLEQVELVHRLRMPGLRGPLVPVGRGVVVHGPPRRVPLLLGGGKEVPPAMERLVEALRRRRHDGGGKGVAARVPGRRLGREIVRDPIEDAADPFAGGRRGAPLLQCRLDVRLERTAGVGEDEQLRDARVERLVDAGEPDRLEMAGDQVPVREVEDRRAHLAVDHRLGVAEEVLVVGALGRCVGDDQGRLPAAARPSAPLGVVRRRRGHVAHVDRVQGRDVDAELHRRGAEEDRQEAAGLAGLPELFLVRRELLALALAEAEALLPDLAAVGIDLGGVLARLEPEERVHRGAEHSRQVLVEVAEERVLRRSAAVRRDVVRRGAAQPEHDAGVVDPPPGLVEGGALLGHEAVRRARPEEVADEPIEVLRAQVPDRRFAAPERRRAQGAAETAS